MVTLRQLLHRARSLFRGREFEQDLDDEISFHLESEIADRVRRGESIDAARAAAHRALGDLNRARDEARDARGVRIIDDTVQDLRFGVRALARTTSFTAASLLTLALGVGGTAAVVGAIHGVILSPLPYPNVNRLVFAWQHDRKHGIERQEVAPGNFLDWRSRNRSFETLAGMEPYGLDYQSPDGPEYWPAWQVTEGFFDLLGVPALHGRVFRADDYVKGGQKVVILGYSLWRKRFGADPAVVGRSLPIEGESYVVVGVMPRDFDTPATTGKQAVWIPKILEGWEPELRTSAFYTVVGRLRDGVDLDRAGADLDRVADQLAIEHPGTNHDIGVTLVPFPEQILGSARSALFLLLVAVGLVLLVAAANLTSLQLARGLDRSRELAVRAALGAGRGRVARQLITENLLVSALGTLLGYGLAVSGLALMRRAAPVELPRPDRLTADWVVLAVAVSVGALISVVAGLVPAAASRTGLLAGLRGSARATASPRARRLRGTLVVIQFATALVLLVGSGLLLRSFVRLLSEDRGFDKSRVLVAVAQLWQYFPKPEARAEFVRQTIERLEATPGVEAAGMTSSIPLAETIGSEQASFQIVGRPGDTLDKPTAHTTVATEGYFRALRIPLHRGRGFGPADRAGTAPVALVNEAFVRQHFAGTEPLGGRLDLKGGRRWPGEVEIVGVVGDVRRHGLGERARPAIYLTHAQSPTGAVGFVIRTRGEPQAIAEQLKRIIWATAPTMPVSSVTTMDELVIDQVRERRFLLALLAAFAIVALALAATGIFGVMSCATAERTREIGIRMAFGADRGRVLRLILRSGLVLAAGGVALGSAGAAAGTRLLRGLLYGIGPLDVPTFIGGAVALFLVALIAAFGPAVRASRLDPSRTISQ